MNTWGKINFRNNNFKKVLSRVFLFHKTAKKAKIKRNWHSLGSSYGIK